MPHTMSAAQIREKNDKFQQRKLDTMFAAALPNRTLALDAVAAESLAMDMEVTFYTESRRLQLHSRLAQKCPFASSSGHPRN